MRALLQNFKNGLMTIDNVPSPTLKDDGILVRTRCSIISSGTEKSVVQLAKMNLLSKARSRPDLVKKVLSKASQEGLVGTFNIVKNLVSAPLPLGYSISGEVISVGKNVNDIKPGQRVACAGLGYANHAEINYVPRNLVAPIPDNVQFSDAAFVTVGSIAMQGVRQANLEVGSNVAIIGMGLIGQITAQICNAMGCNVFCIDNDDEKIKFTIKNNDLFYAFNSSDPQLLEKINKLTNNIGIDCSLITASTKSSQPIKLSSKLLRDRGVIVVIGDVGHNLSRRELYEKEIDIRQSRSYGPGRYDINYEEKAIDYPLGYVRWTENRNMISFLNLISKNKINLNSLVTHSYFFKDILKAYDFLLKSNDFYIGILINYQINKKISKNENIFLKDNRSSKIHDEKINLGIIGAGQFGQGILLPFLKKNKHVSFKTILTSSGITSLNVAKKYKAEAITNSPNSIFKDKSIRALFIASRHDSHAEFVIDALKNNKDIFVEKPLCLNETDLTKICEVYKKHKAILLVGYNRRFSNYSKLLKEKFDGSKVVMNYTINGGPIPQSSWQQDQDIGGGRIVGEVCHFIDLMSYISSSLPQKIYANNISFENIKSSPDNLLINISFSNGSIGNICYSSIGHNNFPKERFEVFGSGYVGVIDNWRSLHLSGNGVKINKNSFLFSDKGFKNEMNEFVNAIKTRKSPINFKSLILTSMATFAIIKSLKTGKSVTVNYED